MARHNKLLQQMLKPGSDPDDGDEALKYYANHTAQIEVTVHYFLKGANCEKIYLLSISDLFHKCFPEQWSQIDINGKSTH